MSIFFGVVLNVPAGVQGIEQPVSAAASEADRLVVPFYYIDDKIGTIRIPSVDIIVYFETTYGYFVYQVDRFLIIEGTDNSVAADSDVEQLTMYTCYPFDYKGNAPQRFVVICTAVPAPEKPEHLSVRQVTPTRIRLNWSAVEGAARYEIFRSTAPDDTFNKIYTAFSTSFLNIRRIPGQVYYYKVRAYSYVNGEKILGPFSEVRCQENAG